MNDGIKVILWFIFIMIATEVCVVFLALFTLTLNPAALLGFIAVISMMSYHKYKSQESKTSIGG